MFALKSPANQTTLENQTKHEDHINVPIHDFDNHNENHAKELTDHISINDKLIQVHNILQSLVDSENNIYTQDIKNSINIVY